MSSLDPRSAKAVLVGYRLGLGIFVKLMSGIAAIAAILFVLGWVDLFSYYIPFSATWIIPDLSVSKIAGNGALHFLILFSALFAAFYLHSEFSWKINMRILTVVVILTFCSYLVALYFIYFSEIIYFQAYLSVICTMAATSLLIGVSLGLIARSLAMGTDRTIEYAGVTVHFFGVLFFLLLFSAFFSGFSKGIFDTLTTQSTLPYVEMKDVAEGNWRLLSTSGDRLYLVDISNELSLIRIINATDVKRIIPHDVTR